MSTKSDGSNSSNHIEWPDGKLVSHGCKIPAGRYIVIAKRDSRQAAASNVAQEINFSNLRIDASNSEGISTGYLKCGFSSWVGICGKVKQIFYDDFEEFPTLKLAEINEDDNIFSIGDGNEEDNQGPFEHSCHSFGLVKPEQYFQLHTSDDMKGDIYNCESSTSAMRTIEGDVLLHVVAQLGSRDGGDYYWLFRKMDGRAAEYDTKSDTLRAAKNYELANVAANFKKDMLPVMSFSPLLKTRKKNLPTELWNHIFSFLTDMDRHRLSTLLRVPTNTTNKVPVEATNKLINELDMVYEGRQPQIVPPGNYVCIASIGDQFSLSVQRDVSEENLTGQVDVYGDGFMGLRYGFYNYEHDDLRTMMFDSEIGGFRKTHLKQSMPTKIGGLKIGGLNTQLCSPFSYSNYDRAYPLCDYVHARNIHGGQRFRAENNGQPSVFRNPAVLNTVQTTMETLDGDIEITLMDIEVDDSRAKGTHIAVQLLLRRVLLNEKDEMEVLQGKLSMMHLLTNVVLHSRTATMNAFKFSLRDLLKNPKDVNDSQDSDRKRKHVPQSVEKTIQDVHKKKK